MHSYDVETEERVSAKKETPRAVGVSRFLRRIIIALTILLLGITIFLFRYQINVYTLKRIFNSIGITGSAESFSRIDLSYDTALSPVFSVSRDLLVMATGGKLEVIDFSGERIYEETVQFISPAFFLEDRQVLIFDRGGYELRRISNYALASSMTFDYPITDARVNRYGEMVTVTGAKTAKSTVTVFNSRGREEHKRSFAEMYIICADIASNGKNFVTASLGVRSGEIVSRVSFFSVSEEDPLTYTEFPGELILSADYKSDGNLTVVTDTSFYTFSSGGEMLSSFSFSGRVLQYFSESGGETAVILNKNQIGANTNLLVLDSNGKQMCDVYLGSEIKKLVTDGNIVLVLAGDRMLVYNIYGTFIESIRVSSDIRDILISKQYGVVGIYIDRAESININ